MDNPAGAWHVVREDNVADLYVKDAEEVVRKLDTMYYARVPGSLIWMKSLFSGLIEFNRQLVTMEKGSKAGR